MRREASPRHVLQVLEPRLGGVPGYVAALSHGLAERGWRVSVAGPSSGHMERLARSGVAIHDLAIAHRPAVGDLAHVRRLARLVRHEGVGLIHAHSTKAGLLAGLAGRLANVPSLYTPHAWAFEQSIGRAARTGYAALERVLAARCHRAIALVADAERIAARANGIASPCGLHVIHTGIRALELPERASARDALGIAEDALVAAWIGRRAPQKRPWDLAPLARRLAGAGVELIALGHGLPGSREAAALRAAGGRVLAADERPARLYAAADILVQTSAWEGLPLSVLEAMSAGLPVVAYDVGGLREQVEDGVTGHLVPCGQLEWLADRITALAYDETIRLRMGSAGRARAGQRFGYEQMLDRMEALYEAVSATRTLVEGA
jgi:glycosyltransferase involved in cell wall biosynthesis